MSEKKYTISEAQYKEIKVLVTQAYYGDFGLNRKVSCEETIEKLKEIVEEEND